MFFSQEIFKKPEVDSSQQGYMQRYVWGWGSWYYGTGTNTDDESMGEETDVDAASSSRLSKSPPKIGELSNKTNALHAMHDRSWNY